MSNIIEGITKDLKAIPKKMKAKAGGMHTKKLVLLNLLYIVYYECVWRCCCPHFIYFTVKRIVYHRCGNDEAERTDCLVFVTSPEDI